MLIFLFEHIFLISSYTRFEFWLAKIMWNPNSSKSFIIKERILNRWMKRICRNIFAIYILEFSGTFCVFTVKFNLLSKKFFIEITKLDEWCNSQEWFAFLKKCLHWNDSKSVLFYFSYNLENQNVESMKNDKSSFIQSHKTLDISMMKNY